MHVAEGVLSGPVLVTGAAVMAVGTGIGLKKLDYDQIVKAGMLSAAFFVASLIHVPIGPANAHLILNGLLGLLLGWGAFPAILVALILQCSFFQFGGITTLGVNTTILALPAVCCYLVLKRFLQNSARIAMAAAFGCGFFAVLLSGLMLSLSLIFTEKNFIEISVIILVAHLPVMFIEGIINATVVAFLVKVRPELLIADSG